MNGAVYCSRDHIKTYSERQCTSCTIWNQTNSLLQPLDTSLLPRGCTTDPVVMDNVGSTADGLVATIKRCIETAGHAPKVLYLVPNCQNPTGSTLTLQRKQDVYAVCQQHNVLILEDYPYALLQFPSQGNDMPGNPPPPPPVPTTLRSSIVLQLFLRLCITCK